MPIYKDIKQNTKEGARTLERLLALRRQMDNEIPKRTLKRTLLLGTWNIRDFDSPAYGDRISEAFYYIAEIIAHFDIVAIQEVRKDLKALKHLKKLLGGYWKYIVTDQTEGDPGNKERIAFIYDTRKVKFGGLAGEMVLPPISLGRGKYKPVSQVARTPFICGFRAGWTRFMLSTVHIIYGKQKAEDPKRIKEIQQVARFLKKRTESKTSWSQNLILLGDFNIFRPEDKTMEALLNEDFTIPKGIWSLPSNASRNKCYDQIAFRVRDKRFTTTGRAGVLDYYKTVFRDEDEDIYITFMGNSYDTNSKKKPRTKAGKSRYYITYWRTHQMSDHLPMWVELEIDFSDDYLNRKLNASKIKLR